MRLVALGTGAVLLVIIVLLIAGGGGGTAPGTTVAGIDMSGDPAEVRAEVQARADTLLRREVRLTAGGGTVATVRPADLGATVDVDATVRAAGEASPGRLVRGIKALTGQGPNEVPLAVSYRKGALEAWTAEIAARVDRDERNAAVTVAGTTFTVTPAKGGRMLERRVLQERMGGDLASLPAEVPIPLRDTRPALGTAEAKEQVAEAGTILRRGGAVVA